ncbi:hypothetical protein LDENG_00230370 [Lucifuga dentata]|nr:hypothetical protein LDENG_00230370 [Lucifuga dentata]
MDSVDQVKPRSEAEALWLKELSVFLTKHVCPLLCDSAPPAAGDGLTGGSAGCMSQLIVGVVRWIQKHTLPVSYR